MVHMKYIRSIVICLFVFDSMIHGLRHMPSMMLDKASKASRAKATANNMILRNPHSFYQINRIISNETNDINKIYTTYNHKYSLIYYKDGRVNEVFNQTLKLKCNQDIIQLYVVSLGYFRRLYADLCQLREREK